MRTAERELVPGLFCREAGAGPTVLLLHCSAGTGAQWRALAAQLAGSFRVLAPDLPGYGGSPALEGPRAGLRDHAFALSRLLDDAHGPVHLVGHSFGGAVALRLATLLGRRVRSLALVEPVAFQHLHGAGDLEAAACAHIAAVARDMREHVARGRADAAMRRFVDSWNGDGSFAALEPARRAALAASAAQVIDDFDAIDADTPPPGELASIRTPTLVLHGGRSPPAASTIARRLAAGIPAAQRVRIRDAGHMAPVTHAEMVNLLLTAHLEFAEHRARRERAGAHPADAAFVPTGRLVSQAA